MDDKSKKVLDDLMNMLAPGTTHVALAGKVIMDMANHISDEKADVVRAIVASREIKTPTFPDEASLILFEKAAMGETKFVQEGFEMGALTEEGVKLSPTPIHEVIQHFAAKEMWFALRALRLAHEVRRLREELKQADMDRETAWAALGRRP